VPGGVRVEVANTEDLDEATRATIVRVCVAAHGEPDFERLFSYVPSGGRHFLGYDGPALVSHAVVTTRWLHHADRRLETAYVDAVATLPAAQRRGIGSAVMRRLGTGIDDHQIACLETEIPGFYARLGWELWRGPLAGLRGSERIPTPAQRGIMVLRLPRTPQVDLDGDLAVEVDGRIW
jgi:aminoglycoside 2'-N-acetyltransferase I